MKVYIVPDSHLSHPQWSCLKTAVDYCTLVYSVAQRHTQYLEYSTYYIKANRMKEYTTKKNKRKGK